MTNFNTYLECIVGSRLYGTFHEDSDTDTKGLFLEKLENIFGIEPVEHSTIEDGVGKNRIESTMYTTRYFLSLYMDGSPTICEVMWADECYYKVLTPQGRQIIEFCRAHLTTKHLYKSYIGYFRSQLYDLKFRKYVGKRVALIEKYGYDTKCAYHSYRIGKQLQSLLQDGFINPTLNAKDRDICLKIRNGEIPKEDLVVTLDQLDAILPSLNVTSKLPLEPNRALVNEFLVQFYKDNLKLMA